MIENLTVLQPLHSRLQTSSWRQKPQVFDQASRLLRTVDKSGDPLAPTLVRIHVLSFDALTKHAAPPFSRGFDASSLPTVSGLRELRAGPNPNQHSKVTVQTDQSKTQGAHRHLHFNTHKGLHFAVA